MRFTEMSKLVNGWSVRNFGNQPSYRPLLGLSEEIGELGDAIFADDNEKIVDSLADITIFAMDYAVREGLDTSATDELSDYVPQVDEFQDKEEFMFDLARALGKICHAHLKSEQGIRVSENHKGNKEKGIFAIIKLAREFAASINEDYDTLVQKTWDQVSKREWKSNPVNGVS